MKKDGKGNGEGFVMWRGKKDRVIDHDTIFLGQIC